jgi:predicted nucleic acid-binding protein
MPWRRCSNASGSSDNVTAYAAEYVAVADRLDGPLVSRDATLTAADDPRCTIELP